MCFLIYSTCKGLAIYARDGPALAETGRGAHEGLARQVQTILRETRVCFSSVSCPELHECCHRSVALTDKPLNAVGLVISAVGALVWVECLRQVESPAAILRLLARVLQYSVGLREGKLFGL